MSGKLRADYAGMQAQRAGLASLGATAAGWPPAARGPVDDAVAAAGSFGADLATGATAFAQAWGSTFETFGESANLLAANLGQAVLILSDLDGTLAGSSTPAGPRPLGGRVTAW